MDDEPSDEKANVDPADDSTNSKSRTSTSRKIPGNLPYLTSSGTLKRAMERLIEASRPDKFNYDFLENVLKLTGGAARATIPIFKRIGLLASDGTPTELYARFRSEGGRGPAALQALKVGFPEIYKRSEYAHSVTDNKLRDIIVEITGLPANDPVAVAIKGTFNAIKGFIPAGMESSGEDLSSVVDETAPTSSSQMAPNPASGRLGLTYNINIVLPETSDLRVLNAIFKSLKDNLLQ